MFTMKNIILAKMRNTGVNKSSSAVLLYDKHRRISVGIEGRPIIMLTCKSSCFPLSSDTLKEAKKERIARVRKAGNSTKVYDFVSRRM